MKAQTTILSLALIVCGCAVKPVATTQADGTEAYTINCDSGIDKCHQKAAKLCPAGYDIIEHSKTSSSLVPHYGEYPMVVNVENVLISCH